MSSKLINYTNKDYNSIRNFLIEHIRQFYPTTYKDFTDSSFGAMTVDLMSLIGDTLSFYIDYQANESILDTARDLNNIIKLAKEKGWKDTGKQSAYGEIDLYILVPADPVGEPDTSYMPILQKDSSFSVRDTNASFLLLEDVDFSKDDVKKVVAKVDSNGMPSFFALKAKGKVISGAKYVQTEAVTTFQNYLKVRISNQLLSEIISVTDSNGNEYHQVDYLTQNVVYKYVKNTGSNSDLVPYVLSKVYAPRRFVIENNDGFYYLVFGNGSVDSVTDPRNLVLDFDSRRYVQEKKIDPKNIIQSDKFGISPVNTTLSIVYRANNVKNIGASSRGLSRVLNSNFIFPQEGISLSKRNSVISSLEIENENPIASIEQTMTSEEIKNRAYGVHSAQDRAVTKEDYITMCYAMDPKFGVIKRADIQQDTNSFKRNLNLYVCGIDSEEKLCACPDILKQNLKTWLMSKKMINDTIDIINAKIINLYIEFTVDTSFQDKNFVFQKCINKLSELYAEKFDIGQSFSVSQIYKTLNLIPEVIDCKKVKVKIRDGYGYASTNFDVNQNFSPDGDYIYCPKDSIFEIKYIENDIVGTVI
jgi:hypothetical protein